MPLQTTAESTTSDIAHMAKNLAGFLSAAIGLGNQMAAAPLSLATTDLNDWLNAKPVEQRYGEFASHGLLGEALNSAAAVAEASLGLPEESIGRVNVASVPEKLAAMRRDLKVGEGGFFVTDLPPEESPTPEP